MSARETTPVKEVPRARADRERIRQRAVQVAAGLDPSRPLARSTLETHARTLLADLGYPPTYLGWTMVALASAFWEGMVETVPHHRRLLLLPHCLRKADTCPAKYDHIGLLCENCGACHLSELKTEAERLGYRVLIAEGSPIVLQMILRGQADAILGAACLNSLEKAFSKILLTGIPCMAVPLLSNSCRDTSTDLDWVRDMIATPHRPGRGAMTTYIPLLRLAAGMFEPGEFERLVPRSRPAPSLARPQDPSPSAVDPIAATEVLARDFLLRGGKYLRPFITLAAYDAMTGRQAAGGIPDAVRRVALAIEVFHKASLVHDDIEDDDPFRYGQPAMHRQHGVPAALNVGDYLIGLGYRLVAQQRAELGASATVEVLARLAQAHTRLCEGQGAELAWRQSGDKRIAPLEALRIYALKTAPAFEAALWAGLRLAGDAEPLGQAAARFSRHLGVAYQILNDLDDWRDGETNKRTSGTDVLGGRPTVLWAMALENLSAGDRDTLESLVASGDDPAGRIASARSLYEKAGVFDHGAALVEKHRARAHAVADTVEPPSLRSLLHYLADAILQG